MSQNEDLDKIYEIAKKWISEHDELNPETIIELVTDLIPATQRVIKGSKKGSYKKEIVLTVMGKILDNDVTFSTPEQEQLVRTILEHTVPKTIDVLVMVATGKKNIGKKVKNCFKICFGQ